MRSLTIRTKGWKVAVCVGLLHTIAALSAWDANAQPSESSQATLSASDMAILYPIKPTAEPDSIFPVAGDGLCNAPALSGPDAPLLNTKDFHALVDQVFGVQSAIAVPEYLSVPDAQLPIHLVKRKHTYEEWSDLDTAQSQRQAQLAQVADEYQNGDYNAPLFCQQPRLAGGITDLADDYQLELGHHLVQSEGVQRIACIASAWRVVGIRFNPCLEQAEIPGFWQGEEGQSAQLPEACTTRELRLVAQPVYRDQDRVVVADVAMHLIYHLTLADVTQLVQRLRAIKGLWQASPLASLPSAPTLAPHAGLMAEMNRCDGPVAGALKDLLAALATRDRLASVAWLSSAASQSKWSFGSLPAKAIGAPQETSAMTASLSLSELSQRVDRFPFAPKTMTPHATTIAEVYQKPFRNPKAPITAPELLAKAKGVFDRLDRLENPTLISQVARDPHAFGSDCLSCHMTGQSRARLSSAVDGRVQGSGAQVFRNRAGLKATPWPRLPPRRLTNLRNFGYGPGSADRFLPAIATRALHEAVNLTDVVAKFFPPVSADMK